MTIRSSSGIAARAAWSACRSSFERHGHLGRPRSAPHRPRSAAPPATRSSASASGSSRRPPAARPSGDDQRHGFGRRPAERSRSTVRLRAIVCSQAASDPSVGSNVSARFQSARNVSCTTSSASPPIGWSADYAAAKTPRRDGHRASPGRPATLSPSGERGRLRRVGPDPFARHRIRPWTRVPVFGPTRHQRWRPPRTCEPARRRARRPADGPRGSDTGRTDDGVVRLSRRAARADHPHRARPGGHSTAART